MIQIKSREEAIELFGTRGKHLWDAWMEKNEGETTIQLIRPKPLEPLSDEDVWDKFNAAYNAYGDEESHKKASVYAARAVINADRERQREIARATTPEELESMCYTMHDNGYNFRDIIAHVLEWERARVGSGEWQPIETLPKDGLVEVCDARCQMDDGWYITTAQVQDIISEEWTHWRTHIPPKGATK